MRNIKKVIKYVMLAILILILIYLGLYGFFLYRSPLPFTELDFNQDGIPSIGELEYTSNYGIREFVSNGNKCIEYYSLKDGLPIKTVCEN